MTLVLATFLDDAILLAADSRVGYGNRFTGKITGHGVDQKLFIFTDVAIATFGTGADGERPVPKVINEFQSGISFDEAIAKLLSKFRSDEGVKAIVGGITAEGPKLTRLWPSKNEMLPLHSPKPWPIWSAGDVAAAFEVASDSTPVAVRDRMQGLFENYARDSDSIGPPFEFVELHQNRELNRSWKVSP